MNDTGVSEESRWESPFGLSSLTLSRFRNYTEETVRPGTGLNVVCGPNAQGKTSLLEAVALLSTGRVLRSSTDSTAIQIGQDTAVVEGTTTQSGTTLSVQLRRGVRKRVLVNDNLLPRAADILGRLPMVSFSSVDLEIVTGDPADRRQFLDWELAQLYPAYLKHLTTYKRALEHRNALLKAAQEQSVDDLEFESWEAPMAVSGTALRAAREQWVKEVSVEAGRFHAELGAGEELAMSYAPKEDDAFEDLAGALAGSRRRDVGRGSTSVGPHRDELSVRVAGKEARYFASQGQQRTAVISLKLAVLTSVRNEFRRQPVLLLDDVFSDLDVDRRAELVKLTVGQGGQVFLTCTDFSQAGSAAGSDATLFEVQSGKVRRL